jgi:hypothetical protein
MAAGLEADACEQLIYSTLNGDATLTALVTGVYIDLAPEGTAFPFVVFQEMSGRDLMEVGSNRIWTNFVYSVKVIGQTASFADLRTAVARVDVLLHKLSGTAASGTIHACIREQSVRLLELAPGGLQVRHSGGIYRLYAS